MSIELTPAHGALLATVLGAVGVHNVWMSLKVGAARKLYNVRYPALYAPEGHKNANIFNCIQRAHQNSLENLPTFYALLLTAGVKYPLFASACGAIILLGRIMYFNGYSTGDPKGRMKGGWLHLGELGLLAAVARWSVELLAPALKL